MTILIGALNLNKKATRLISKTLETTLVFYDFILPCLWNFECGFEVIFFWFILYLKHIRSWILVFLFTKNIYIFLKEFSQIRPRPFLVYSLHMCVCARIYYMYMLRVQTESSTNVWLLISMSCAHAQTKPSASAPSVFCWTARTLSVAETV